jgi:hypothetical protein
MTFEEELHREITENILPMAAIVGLLVGFWFTYEALVWLQDDINMVVTLATNTVLGPLSALFAAFLIVSRISATQAIEVYMNNVTFQDRNRRNIIIALSGLAACAFFQISATIGSVVASEVRLPRSTEPLIVALLMERVPVDWIIDNFLAAIMGFLISQVSIHAAVVTEKTDERRGAGAASRSVSWGILVIFLCEIVYWTVRSAFDI